MENNNERVDEQLIQSAINILKSRVATNELTRPEDVRKLLLLEHSSLEREVFGAVLLNAHARYLDHKILFLGSITSVQVSPREIIKYALEYNAAQMIIFHNHPGGSPLPSSEDIKLTKTLAEIFKFVDVHLADHILIRAASTYSFAEHGLMPN